MANIQNFETDINNLAAISERFTVSRVIANKQDDLLEIEMPASFPENILENNIEVSLYSLADNSLVYHTVIKQVKDKPTPFKTEVLQYTDGTSRTLLFIDFAAIQQISTPPAGRYQTTLNFFIDEVGSDDQRILKVNNISTSRTEVELKLTDATQQHVLEQFAVPRIPTEYVNQVLVQIFNQSKADEILIPTSPVRIDSSSLYQNFASGSGEKLIQYGFDEDDGSQIGINTIMQNVLNVAYPTAMNAVTDAVLIGSRSFTETELSNIVVNAIDLAYDTALNDEAQNPQNYRFDLI